MKKNFRNVLFLLAAVIAISSGSCKKEKEQAATTPTPTPTPVDTNAQAITGTYYVQAKFDGVWKTSQTSAQIGCQTPNTLCWSTSSCGFWIEFPCCSTFTSSQVTALQGQTLGFTESTTNNFAGFGWIDKGTPYVQPQSGSCIINKVTADGNFGGYPSFKLEGTFNCKIANSDGTGETTITNGKFSMRGTIFQ